MGISHAQISSKPRRCRCGCGKTFVPFPVYRPKTDGGGLRYPRYIRGHHPRRFGKSKGKPWNAGLTKADHPSIARMGFQRGHEPHNDWSRVNLQLRSDPRLYARWVAAKKGKPAWNKGLTRDRYPNGIASGPNHGNWAGGHGGIRDTAEYERFRLEIFKRDRYRCRQCGDRNHKGRGRRAELHMDHIIPLCVRPDLALDPSNVRLLCRACHQKTETFGSKAVRLKRSGTKRQDQP